MRNPVRSVSTLVLGLALGLSACTGPAQGGDELDIAESYGATNSYDGGVTFTDGVTIIEVKKGPIRLISAEPVLSDANPARYLGARVRLLGRPDWIPHTTAEQFPPTNPEMAGSSPVNGFEVSPVAAQERTHIELMFGFEVTGQGRITRRGVNLTYEYGGEKRKAFVPSYLAVCVPKVPVDACAAEDENGIVATDQPSGS